MRALRVGTAAAALLVASSAGEAQARGCVNECVLQHYNACWSEADAFRDRCASAVSDLALARCEQGVNGRDEPVVNGDLIGCWFSHLEPTALPHRLYLALPLPLPGSSERLVAVSLGPGGNDCAAVRQALIAGSCREVMRTCLAQREGCDPGAPRTILFSLLGAAISIEEQGELVVAASNREVERYKVLEFVPSAYRNGFYLRTAAGTCLHRGDDQFLRHRPCDFGFRQLFFFGGTPGVTPYTLAAAHTTLCATRRRSNRYILLEPCAERIDEQLFFMR